MVLARCIEVCRDELKVFRIATAPLQADFGAKKDGNGESGGDSGVEKQMAPKSYRGAI
jgi:hypothetical protein